MSLMRLSAGTIKSRDTADVSIKLKNRQMQLRLGRNEVRIDKERITNNYEENTS